MRRTHISLCSVSQSPSSAAYSHLLRSPPCTKNQPRVDRYALTVLPDCSQAVFGVPISLLATSLLSYKLSGTYSASLLVLQLTILDSEYSRNASTYPDSASQTPVSAAVSIPLLAQTVGLPYAPQMSNGNSAVRLCCHTPP